MKYILLTVIISIVSSCSAQKNSVTDELTGTQWFLVELKGKKIETDPAAAKNPYILLEQGDSTFTGFGICNVFSGTYKLTDSSLSFNAAVVTEIACLDYRIEQHMMEMFNNVTGYYFEDKYLILYTGNRTVIARLKVKKPE